MPGGNGDIGWPGEEALLCVQPHIDGSVGASDTLKQQKETERLVAPFLARKSSALLKNDHVGFVMASIDSHLPQSMSLCLLGEPIPKTLHDRAVGDLKLCRARDGRGFGGVKECPPHVLTTFASICAIACLGTPEALSLISRQEIGIFLVGLRNEDGSFCVHANGGESDLRATYAAVSIMDLLNLDEMRDSYKDSIISYVLSCLSYEGGFGAVPGAEAHGGYTFCGIATLSILNSVDTLALPQLERLKGWIQRRQMGMEGGFQGRCNKLVDSCYSYWIGAISHMLRDEKLVDASSLASYILSACQDEQGGGLRDKPGKSPDLYHTCYALGGLCAIKSYMENAHESLHCLMSVHPTYNLVVESVSFMKDWQSSYGVH